MKIKKYLFGLIIIIIFLAGCTNRVYKQGKPFKPDRRNQVTNCHTYYDVRR